MSLDHAALIQPLDDTLLVDRFALRDMAERIMEAQRARRPFDRLLQQFQTRLRASQERVALRRRNRPAISYDPELPITALHQELADAIQKHPVVVVCGETGSGKSTQLPKICLDIGRGIHGLIGHTQPRRIAARSIAGRLAEELSSAVGRHVGFKIRFSDTTSADSYVKLMTDGILLAETQGDPWLHQYDTIIVDEAHERSLNIDFLLGYLQRLLPQRPELRVIITSATIDVERFSQHFATAAGPAPIIMVSGRTYPVDVWYRPPHLAEDDEELDLTGGVLEAIAELQAVDRHGDILVFLPTERDILATAKALRGRAVSGGGEDNHTSATDGPIPTARHLSTRAWSGFDIVPLYARLSTAEQNRVFEPHSRRRIVLATNVAESSLTVPGIRYVIDTGLARISRYAPRSKIQRLPIEPISQASADQRKGRCGRLGPGICIRLYEEEDYQQRERFTPAEIRRSNLAAVILQAASLQLGPLDQFPFLDPPLPQLIRDGYATLFELGAVDQQQELTPLGDQLSRLPVDPRIGRMIIAGHEEHCLSEILVIAAALEARDPRERPVDKQAAADEAHARFADPDSDFLALLNIWRFFHDLKEKLSKSQLRKACQQNYLSYMRLREWQDVHLQLQQLVHEHVAQQQQDTWRIKPISAPPETKPERDRWFGAIHRAILSGLLANVALKKDHAEYTGAGNIKLNLWPGSYLAPKKPLWIMAAELVETTRRFARTAARIQPDWIEPLAPHLVDREYSEPHWSTKHGAAMAFEKVSLFGLTITSRKLVPYGPIDPEWSRGEFIRHGLVGGEWRGPAEFLTRNRQLQTQLGQLAARTRRTDLVADEYSMMAFYRRKLPPDVFDGPRLTRWLRAAERERTQLLCMQLTDLCAATSLPTLEDYPDHLLIDRLKLMLEYRFEPGAPADGVTAIVPRAALGQLHVDRLEWLVPGYVEEKIVALIRALPKSLRRNLVPVPDTAKAVKRELTFAQGPFLEAVARLLSRHAEETITREQLEQVPLPDHCRLNIRVVDEQQKILGEGRDLVQLQQKFVVRATGTAGDQPLGEWHRDGLKTWDLPSLPAKLLVNRAGITLTRYPTLVDQQTSVGLRMADSAEEAETGLRAGVRRLYVLSEFRALQTHVEWFPELKQLSIQAAGLWTATQLRDQLQTLLADRAFLADRPMPRSRIDFEAGLQYGRKQVELAVRDVVKVVTPLIKNYHAVRLQLDAAQRLASPVAADVREQLKLLLAPGFLTTTPWEWLQHLPRYLDAARIRLQKATQGGLARDRQLQTQLSPYLDRYQQRLQENERRGRVEPQLNGYRWLLEEFRVSLFAQQLGTSVPVSPKRLDQALASFSAPK